MQIRRLNNGLKSHRHVLLLLLMALLKGTVTTSPNGFVMKETASTRSFDHEDAENLHSTNGLFAKTIIGQRTLKEPSTREFIAKIRPPLFDPFVKGMQLLFNTTVMLCTLTHYYPIAGKIIKKDINRRKCKNYETSLPSPSQLNDNRGNLAQILNVVRMSSDEKTPLFVRPQGKNSFFQ